MGRLRLVSFDNRASLQAVGGNLFESVRAPSETNASSVRLVQGALERSDVQPTLEMAKLAEINRAYEMAAKLLKDTLDPDDMDKLADVPE